MVFFHVPIINATCKANAWFSNRDNYMYLLKKESPPRLENSRQGSDCIF